MKMNIIFILTDMGEFKTVPETEFLGKPQVSDKFHAV
jgi:hypothetical protein